MPLEANDIIRCVPRITMPFGANLLNTWFLRLLGTGTANEDDVADGVRDYFEDFYGVYSARLPVGTTFPDMLIEHVAWEETPLPPGWKTQQTLYYGIWTPVGAPAGADPGLSAQNAVLITLVTAIRKHTGRKYLGGFTEAQNIAGALVEASLIQDLLTFGATLLVNHAIPNSTLEFGVCVPNMSGNATNFPHSIVIGNIWRSQRRRQQGVGL